MTVDVDAAGRGPATEPGHGPAPLDESPTAAQQLPPDAGRPPTVPAVDRNAALAAGAPKMSKKVIGIAIAVLLVLGVGGSLAEHFVTDQVASTTTKSIAQPGLPAATATPPAGALLHASLASLLGIQNLHDTAATGFSLTDVATGATVSLSALRGRVVVLTFANAACNDICPVLAKEISTAAAMMGTTTTPVTFVTVNTDPLALTRADATMLDTASLDQLPNYRFLTGSIHHLNAVWTNFGISITANKSTGVVTHNELMYFIRPNGKIAWSAIPFANESRSGTYSLPAAQVTRFAKGIAHYAHKLADAS